jgi:hypothetical protein
MTVNNDKIAANLRKSRKKRFPKDTIADFAMRCEIGLSTYKKMEKGDLSVGMWQYAKSAKVLGLESGFDQLFKLEDDWFND